MLLYAILASDSHFAIDLYPSREAGQIWLEQ
jgi:hypothetical protein